MYKIEADFEKHCVMILISNSDDEEPAAFAADMKRAASAIRQKNPYFDILADHTQASMVIPQERMGSVNALVEWCDANGLRKSANIVDSFVQRMQLKRVTANNPSLGYFKTRAEAEAWLDEQ